VREVNARRTLEVNAQLFDDDSYQRIANWLERFRTKTPNYTSTSFPRETVSPSHSRSGRAVGGEILRRHYRPHRHGTGLKSFRCSHGRSPRIVIDFVADDGAGYAIAHSGRSHVVR